MQESRETLPQLTTKDELDALYKSITKTKESKEEPIDPNTILAKISTINTYLNSEENKGKNIHIQGKEHVYDLSLGQQKEKYKVTTIMYDKIVQYDIITENDRGTWLIKITITRNEDRSETVCTFEEQADGKWFSLQIKKEAYMQEMNAMLEEIYTYSLQESPVVPQE